MLQQRAQGFVCWLEDCDADVLILVGHACFLGMITGDKVGAWPRSSISSKPN